MGTVKTEITLKNTEIRALTVEAVVDTGASAIVITARSWAWRLRSASL